MKLTKGICVIPTQDFKESSIQINKGSVHYSAMNFEKLDFPFKKDAFIPKDEWRNLTEQELPLVFSQHYEYSDYIYIGKLPDDIISDIEKFNIHKLKDRNIVFERMKEKEYLLKGFNEKLNNFITKLSTDDNKLEFHRMSVIPSGRYTTSINLNMDEFEYLGMHIDHSTGFEIETANQSRNRICINIGNEDRYLYIINLSLRNIKEMLRMYMNADLLNVENIGDYFFKYFPDYPVLKIRQAPYEYYIAPTDNFIHDGSTFRNTYLDITITFLGNFEYHKSI
jgi:hypothetical protein